jgi:DNA-binding LacI/PurR family transcriptional regulator
MNAVTLSLWAQRAEIARKTLYAYLAAPESVKPNTRTRIESAAAALKIDVSQSAAGKKKGRRRGATKETQAV